ncbi:MAG: hypothetical protein QN173_06425 [Armatimonadota bacterium]|nr:hypothetical protein [Armatimonadota bacterium]MDR7402793.1 hypothetical protein [Armatimonadota bacterium]MDR7404654.1 hypothetical protein [Armatimonadota bacterium]MDR7437044.1 hypothetical protein [Armatimonadota bacterium]MDR7472885.1 hypothetical protein [Armatimonadota bacterium]
MIAVAQQMAQSLASSRAPAPVDAAGKSLGLAVFGLGVVLLLGVFGLAYRDLVAAGDGLSATRLLAAPAVLAVKGALLVIMGAVASAIANKGIALYQAARLPLE